MSGAFVLDDDLDAETRALYAEHLTPRRINGALLWPVDELPMVEPVEDVPALDPSIVQETQRRQQARRTRQATRRAHSPARRSCWAHVPLGDLFKEAGNALYQRGSGVYECGHEPLHASRGGRCVQIDPTMGLWWCRSCRQGGDAVTFVMAVQGCSRDEAEAVLFLRFGAPKAPAGRRKPKIIEITLP